MTLAIDIVLGAADESFAHITCGSMLICVHTPFVPITTTNGLNSKLDTNLRE